MRPQDIVVLLKKTTSRGRYMIKKELAASLHLSASEISESLERSRVAKLVDHSKSRVNIMALKEFLQYGIKYVYPLTPGKVVRGIATASAAPPINRYLSSNGDKFVWPTKNGSERGLEILPLYPTVTEAIQKDQELYELLVIVDSLRIGTPREQAIALAELAKRFATYGKE